MENSETTTTISSAPNPVGQKVHRYAVWAVLPDHVSNRIKKVMEGLRDEFGGPEIRPHIPVLGSIHSKEDDIVKTSKRPVRKLLATHVQLWTCSPVDSITKMFTSSFIQIRYLLQQETSITVSTAWPICPT